MTPQRIQLSRARGWRLPEGAVVVSRPSKWGNPYHVDMYRDDYPDADLTERRRMAVSDFRGLVTGRWGEWAVPTYPPLAEIRAELAGKDLACWCPLDEPCHADVLLEPANGEPS